MHDRLHTHSLTYSGTDTLAHSLTFIFYHSFSVNAVVILLRLEKPLQMTLSRLIRRQPFISVTCGSMNRYGRLVDATIVLLSHESRHIAGVTTNIHTLACKSSDCPTIHFFYYNRSCHRWNRRHNRRELCRV